MENNNKAKWINTILDNLDKSGNSSAEQLVESCGRKCLESRGVLEKIDTIRKDVKNLSDFDLLFKLYKEKIYNNSDRLTKEGNTIILVYNECGCGMVNEGGVSNPFLCNCTKGYTKAIFEYLFNCKINVALKESILNGSKKCKQKIVIQEN